MKDDENAGRDPGSRATGGVIPPGLAATEKHPHICNCYTDEGHAAPASPIDPATPVTLGFDGSAAGEATIVAADADGRLTHW